ncbi:MAG: ATP-binding protein [Clostridiales bacterium]|nr:ATP-binding protein [Clostridiales bacterium]
MKISNLPATNRISIITGHYGSGKTEFSLSLAMMLAKSGVSPLAVIDLDIANPYFRSRERRAELEAAGIGIYGSLYDKEITAELPALGASLRAPLENRGARVIVDAGGNDSGALVLNQFRKYFTDDDSTAFAVVNFSRYETRTVGDAALHILAIERVTGLNIRYVINNTHLLRETTPDDIIRGHELSLALCKRLGKKFYCDCYPEPVVDAKSLPELRDTLFPLALYMRPTWLDM